VDSRDRSVEPALFTDPGLHVLIRSKVGNADRVSSFGAFMDADGKMTIDAGNEKRSLKWCG